MALQPKSCIGRLFFGFLYHTQLDTLTVGLLWTNGQFVAESATCVTQNRHKRPTSMPSARFEPTVPTYKRLQTYSLDRTAARIGLYVWTFVHNGEVSSSVQIINMCIKYFSHIRKRLLFSGTFQTSSIFGFTYNENKCVAKCVTTGQTKPFHIQLLIK